jgi:hypothetical protein
MLDTSDCRSQPRAESLEHAHELLTEEWNEEDILVLPTRDGFEVKLQ